MAARGRPETKDLGNSEGQGTAQTPGRNASAQPGSSSGGGGLHSELERARREVPPQLEARCTLLLPQLIF